jgi:hypothetical protein
MKKILAMAAIALFMVSCTDDDSNSTQTGTKLVKVTETDSDGSYISNLTYDGNKLIEINSNDGEKSVITYTGDLVTEWKTYDADNELIYKDTYEYNSQNQLVTYIEFSYDADFGDDVYKTTYVHNANGTISFTEYYSDNLDNPDSFTQDATGTITETTLTTIYDMGEDTEVYTYTFDGKNNPLKAITGMDKIAFANTMGTTKFYNENVVSQSSSWNGGTSVLGSTTVYTYNAANYPLTQTETQADGSYTSTTTYTYE